MIMRHSPMWIVAIALGDVGGVTAFLITVATTTPTPAIHYLDSFDRTKLSVVPPDTCLSTNFMQIYRYKLQEAEDS